MPEFLVLPVLKRRQRREGRLQPRARRHLRRVELQQPAEPQTVDEEAQSAAQQPLQAVAAVEAVAHVWPLFLPGRRLVRPFRQGPEYLDSSWHGILQPKKRCGVESVALEPVAEPSRPQEIWCSRSSYPADAWWPTPRIRVKWFWTSQRASRTT
jgi:hypothetical protein